MSSEIGKEHSAKIPRARALPDDGKARRHRVLLRPANNGFRRVDARGGRKEKWKEDGLAANRWVSTFAAWATHLTQNLWRESLPIR